MALPRVLLTRRIPSSVLSQLSAGATIDLHDGDGPMPRAELVRRVAGVEGLLSMFNDRIDDEVLASAPALRVVANIAVDYDNIDVAAASRRGVTVTNTPDVLTNAVAELTWGLILTLARRVAEGDRLVRAGDWRGWALDFMLGMELKGRQLGIVGAGRIGRAVAAKAAAFGMSTVFASARRDARPADGSIERVSLDRLLVTSDVVSIHAPLTDESRHLIDRRAFARMKRSALLVNTGRGPIVDEEALAWALGERLIAGAALDVYEREPEVLPALRGFENVVLSPHLGSATRDTRTVMAELAVRNVLAVLGGEAPLTPVKAES